MANRILVTGAAGIVGSALRPILAERYQTVLLSDLHPVADLAPNERFVACDLGDLDNLTCLCGEVDGVIHLGGKVGAGYGFPEVLGPNIIGTYHIFQAAHASGVTHVVYASSHHAVGFLRRGDTIDHQTPHRPDSQYGLSKAFGESVGAFFADKYGLNVMSIRIGFVGEGVKDERRLHTWISAQDLAQLIGIGLRTPRLGYQVVYGTSNNPEPFFDNQNATRLGYLPQDRSELNVTDSSLLSDEPDPTTIGGACVGGGFAELGFEGDPRRITEWKPDAP